jgi:hypothetical protein
VLASTLALLLWHIGGALWIFNASLLLLWLASPAVAWWISRPLELPPPDLSAEQKRFLRASARRTWRYFEDFTGPEHNWLTPDNMQEFPVSAVAARTSPTNIGMSLLANLAAWDFGYISARELLRRTDHTLATLLKLKRHRGHFYNWYDTHTLEPLRPHYISSVDSGNLVGCLLTLQAGLAEVKNCPLFTTDAWCGLRDTALVLTEQLPASLAPQLARQLDGLREELSAPAPRTSADAVRALDGILRLATGLLTALSPDAGATDEQGYWARALDRQLRDLREELAAMSAAPEHGDRIPTVADLAKTGVSAATARLKLIDELGGRCRSLAVQDFSFLYDNARELLMIGYDVGERRRDPSCYDLLASEARLASFLLIAQGHLPQKHWFALGRLLSGQGGDITLISWSGSMFEYLMPQLIMPAYENTLLERSCKAAVARQIEYARQRAVPWGISESCYNVTDSHQIYQYRAFGVPGLGFKRGLADDLVIAPYASSLALMVMPLEACRNLQTLEASGFRGAYGFYEAIDYTPSRLPRGKQHVVVRAFMAHHQGMSLLSFAHVLLDHPMQRRFLADPHVRATTLLLQERVPKAGGTVRLHAVESNTQPAAAVADMIMRVFTDPNLAVPEVQLLSNGRYHVMVSHAGGGYSRWRDLAVSRWREDVTRDCWGTFIYLRDRESGQYWSAAYQPTLRRADHYEAIFTQSRAE